MKQDEYNFWKKQFSNFKFHRLFTHIEGTSILLLLVISAIFIISQIPILFVLGGIGLLTIVIIFALIKVEMETYEIKKDIHFLIRIQEDFVEVIEKLIEDLEEDKNES